MWLLIGVSAQSCGRGFVFPFHYGLSPWGLFFGSAWVLGFLGPCGFGSSVGAGEEDEMRVQSVMGDYLLVFSLNGVEKVVPNGQRLPLWALGLLKGKYDNPRVRFEGSEVVMELGVIASNWRRVSLIEWPTRNNPGWWDSCHCQTVEEKKESGFYFVELCEQLLHHFYWEVGLRYCGYPAHRMSIEETASQKTGKIGEECVLSDGDGWIVPTEEELEYIRVYCEKVGIFNLGCVVGGGLELELAIEAVASDCVERYGGPGGPDVRDPRVVSYLMDRHLHSELYYDHD